MSIYFPQKRWRLCGFLYIEFLCALTLFMSVLFYITDIELIVFGKAQETLKKTIAVVSVVNEQ